MPQYPSTLWQIMAKKYSYQVFVWKHWVSFPKNFIRAFHKMLQKNPNEIFWLTQCISYLIHIYCIFFVHSSIDRYLGCLRILVIVNNAVISKGVQISFWYPIFVFFGDIPRSETARSCGSSVCSFLRKLHTIFHKDCTSLHSHQQLTGALFSPYPYPSYLWSPWQ